MTRRIEGQLWNWRLGVSFQQFWLQVPAAEGLLRIVRDFCRQSNALCENRRFPRLDGTLEQIGSETTGRPPGG